MSRVISEKKLLCGGTKLTFHGKPKPLPRGRRRYGPISEVVVKPPCQLEQRRRRGLPPLQHDVPLHPAHQRRRLMPQLRIVRLHTCMRAYRLWDLATALDKRCKGLAVRCAKLREQYDVQHRALVLAEMKAKAAWASYHAAVGKRAWS